MNASHASQAARSSAKRPRASSPTGDQHLMEQTAVGGGFPLPPTRISLACEACRLRKSRCVGFPTCTWCQQRHQPCIRGRNSQTSPLDDWGNQILDALSLAKDEILSAASGSFIPYNVPIQSSNRASAALSGAGNQHCVQQLGHKWNASYPSRDQSGSPGVSRAESILEWDVLRSQLSDLPADLADAKDAYESGRSNQSRASADTSFIGLQELVQRFEHKFLVRYPVVSKVQLLRYARDVAESGGDWNAESCLIFLVSALASLCECSKVDGTRGTYAPVESPLSTISTTTSVRCTPSVPSISQSAYQYWTMAKRRIGWSLDIPDSLLSAQCLCLAGFWHLQTCAPKRACIVFHRAADSVRDEDQYSIISEETKPLAKLVRLVCMDQIQYDNTFPTTPSTLDYRSRSNSIDRRLEVELGLCSISDRSVVATETTLRSSKAERFETTPRNNRPLGADPAPNPSRDVKMHLPQLLAVRTDINRILASTPSISSWHDLHALLGQIADCRSRLGDLADEKLSSQSTPPWLQSLQDGAVTTTAYAANEDIRKRELATLLRACLYLHLSPHLLLSLINTSPAIHSHEHVLKEVAALASECITLTGQILRSQLEKWQEEDPRSSRQSTPQSAVNSPCHHLEAWFSYRFTYAGSLLLLAVHYAKTKALSGEIAYAYCHALTLPAEWRHLVAGNVRVLLEHDEGSNLWKAGKLLSRFDVV